ncbi:group II intron maturase-specific domain-containing protein [Nonomuraea helvata]|uniref:Group II intron maturase-specific domain-containing protein n=1 Tax=Nonomuraea helvata TaxID=37484 RepID=A0ABV5SCI5_9ACTN
MGKRFVPKEIPSALGRGRPDDDARCGCAGCCIRQARRARSGGLRCLALPALLAVYRANNALPAQGSTMDAGVVLAYLNIPLGSRSTSASCRADARPPLTAPPHGTRQSNACGESRWRATPDGYRSRLNRQPPIWSGSRTTPPEGDPSHCVHSVLRRFLRGWAGYFRYGHSAQCLSKIRRYAQMRLAHFIRRRHRRSMAFGWWVLTRSQPVDLGLISLYGIVVAPRAGKPWRERPNAGGERRR